MYLKAVLISLNSFIFITQVYCFHIGEGDNEEYNQTQIAKLAESTNRYLQKLEKLESKLSHFFFQDKTLERIGTVAIVNNGHVHVTEISEPEHGTLNETTVYTKRSTESDPSDKNKNDSPSSASGYAITHVGRALRELKQKIAECSSLGLENIVPKDCSDIQSNRSGLYVIKPVNSEKSFIAYCDMETEGGGWTVFQNRFDGKVDFYRGWNDYKYGFGKTDGEHWLGLQKLHELTSSQLYEIYIKLVDFSNNIKYARYSSFGIGDENEGYRLSFLGEYTGTAGDSMSNDHVGKKYTTYDRDQDTHDNNCAVLFSGAWWYNACHESNLNGKYLNGEVKHDERAKGICWYTLTGYEHSLKTSRMMIRPKRN